MFAIVVTSYAEVWIEIISQLAKYYGLKSPPTRRCGLKFGFFEVCCGFISVTSYAEVWIEMVRYAISLLYTSGHLLRGGVD